jgi:DNA-binding GntR family transcriptional regulator
VEEFEDKNYFGSVESRGIFIESFRFAEVREYFATRAIVELKAVSKVFASDGNNY